MSHEFERVQAKLAAALDANTQGSTVPHVMIALPSYSVSESLLSHYRDRVPSLEHRYLNAIVVAGRIESCEIVYISTRAPLPEVLDYYLDLIPPAKRDGTRERVTIIEVDDGTPRSVATRLLDRPDLIASIRAHVGARPAFIEPWNVTDSEVNLAIALDMPINGTAPELRPLAFKSAGRRLFADAGVPAPFGREDVRTTDDVIAAVHAIRANRADTAGIVIKHDDSGAGDGNAVIDLGPMADAPDADAWLRSTIEALPEWYRTDLALGGVVEERIAGERFSSPSAQVDVRPGGRVTVLATHEQVLGGPGGQVYLGCRFPADPAYAAVLAEHAARIGEQLAARGAIGRFSVDFVAAAPAGGSWDVYAIEVNLRKGGTTHPYAALRNLVPGRYDAAAGQWRAEDGTTRAYSSTDNLVDESWLGLPPADVIRAVRNAGLQFDPTTGSGTVLHMLSGLAIDGRFGLTAIAPTSAEAEVMFEGVRSAVADLASRRAATA
jgi:hypothetical protein